MLMFRFCDSLCVCDVFCCCLFSYSAKIIIRNADKICVVEDGRVVETGKHDELIRVENSKYLQLVRLQLGGALEDPAE